MVNFFCRQEKTFGLGNFINCTPTLKALFEYYKEPIPVLFETVGDAFIDCQFIRHIEKPEGKELFGSYTINSSVPDWLYIFNLVQQTLNINLGEVPKSYIDKIDRPIDDNYCVILRGCFSNIPHKVAAKDPGDDIYIRVLDYILHSMDIKIKFVGTYDDYIRNSNVFKHIGKALEWQKTTLRHAILLVNKAKFIIGNDTGLIHAASALGKDAFCMWEKTSFIKNTARGEITYSRNNHFENFKKWIFSYQ